MAPTLVSTNVSTKTDTKTQPDGSIVKTITTTTIEKYSVDGSTATKVKKQTQTTPAGCSSGKPIGNKYELGFDISKSTASKVAVTTPKDFIQKCLDEHNRLRAIHHAPPLKLNNDLCKIAQGWANKIAKEGKCYHSKYEFGENIFWSTVDQPGDFVVNRWYDEIKDWDWKKNEGNGKGETGHFTQVVWKKTKEMGVAAAHSKDGHFFVVAEYNPPGNFKNRFAENVLPK